MPRIPTYPGVRINAPQYSGPTGQEGIVDLGRGITDLGRGLMRREARLSNEAAIAEEKRQQDEARVYAARSLAALRERMTVEETELQNTIGPGASGYTPEYLKRYDGFVEEIIRGAPNELAKQALTERTAELRGGFASTALTFEASASQMQREKDIVDSTRMSANWLRTHPSDFEAILAELDAGMAAVADKLPQESQDKYTWNMRNGIATSAIEGELQVSPAVANKKLKAGYWDPYITPDQKDAFLKAAASRLQTNNAVAQYQMSRAIDNHLAAVEETGIGIGLTAGQVAAVYGNPVAGMKFGDAERVAGKVHSAKIEIGSRQSPEERAQMLARYKPDRMGRPNTFAEDREVYQRLTTALEQDVKLLATDGAAWADRNGEVSAIARTSGTDHAIAASLAMQERGGIPEHAARVMPVDAAKGAVAAIESLAPVEKLQTLAGMEREYGSFFPKAMTELINAGLSPEFMVVHNVQKVNPQVAALLAESTSIKKEEIQSRFSASGKGAWSTVTASVQGQFDPLDKAITYAFPQRRGQFNAITDLYSKTAGNLVLSGRFSNTNDAAKYLYENSYGSMHVDRTFYLPTETEKGTPINTDKAATELKSLLRSPEWVKDRDLSTNATIAIGGVGNSRQKVDTTLIRSNGIWVNSADGNSLQLFIERKTGFSPVYEVAPGPRGGKTRRPVVVTLEDVANGRVRGNFTKPGDTWKPPSMVESLANPGMP